MSTEQVAKDAFSQVRKRYKASYKSSNKWYFGTSGQMQPTVHRAGQDISRDDLQVQTDAQIQDMFSVTGVGKEEAINWSVMDQIFRTGNCEELSSLILHEVRGLGGRGTTASLSPGDHVFVVVGQNSATDAIHKVKVSDLTLLKTLDVWVADAWLGICCQIANYPGCVAVKLGEWLKAGKRIMWVAPGEDDSSWTTPSGPNGASETYDSLFLRSQITVGEISPKAWT